jgi:hypothetical protein
VTIDEYATDSGALDDNSGPTIDPMDKAMVDHIVEFETEMFRLDCYRKYSRLNSKHLQKMMIDIHGEYWRDAL